MRWLWLTLLFIFIAFLAIGSLAKANKVKDTDKDGIPNPIDEDIDGDGVPNIVETQHGTDPYNPFSYLIEDTLLGGG